MRASVCRSALAYNIVQYFGDSRGWQPAVASFQIRCKVPNSPGRAPYSLRPSHFAPVALIRSLAALVLSTIIFRSYSKKQPRI